MTEGRWETANSQGIEGCIPDPDDESDSEEAEAEEREAARRSQLDMLLNVPTNVPSNALVLLSVRTITTLINSPVGEFCTTKPAYSLSKPHSTSNRAMAQMKGSRCRLGMTDTRAVGWTPGGFEASPAVVCVAGCAGEVEEAGGRRVRLAGGIMRLTKERRIYSD